jgi:serine/threonine protein phosphatase PrpC
MPNLFQNKLSDDNIILHNAIKKKVPNPIKIQTGNLAMPKDIKVSGPLATEPKNAVVSKITIPVSPSVNNKNIVKNFKNLDIESLSKIQYELYPQVQLSTNSFSKIAAYGANSYTGIFKKTNEDKLKIILDYKSTKTFVDSNGNIINPNISYFAIYDGHGGDKCSNFLQEKLDSFLFNSDFFPSFLLKAVYEAYTKAEQEFETIALDPQKTVLLDKSGSCALSLIIIDDWCHVAYLGDSRGLYSFDSGNQLFQITRDHKPNDFTEKKRIESAGGRVYKDTRLKINGHKIRVNEQSMPGFKFPFRVFPGNLSVRKNISYKNFLF